MMTDEEQFQDVRDKAQIHHTVLFGAEGQGGLVRDVDSLKKAVADIDGKVNTISGKWLALMTVLAIAGQFLARFLIR